MRFEDLEVWKRAARLSADLYRYFSQSTEYGFRDQITRAGLSIPSNIAEGMERESLADNARFLTIAKSSCGELRTQIYIGIEAGFIEKEQGMIWVKESKELSAMLVSLTRKLQK